MITGRLSSGAETDLLHSGVQETPMEDFVVISVSDTGEGIKAENMNNLFQPLFTTKARGIGLGLAVSKKLTEANGGKIWAESVQGKGTTLRVALPIRPQIEATEIYGG